MLVVQRSASVLAAVEDDHVVFSKRSQRKPGRLEIAFVQKLILRLKFNCMQDHLWSDRAKFVEDEFVPCSKDPQIELLGVVCEGRGSLFAARGPGLSSQAISHMELELW